MFLLENKLLSLQSLNDLSLRPQFKAIKHCKKDIWAFDGAYDDYRKLALMKIQHNTSYPVIHVKCIISVLTLLIHNKILKITF